MHKHWFWYVEDSVTGEHFLACRDCGWFKR